MTAAVKNHPVTVGLGPDKIAVLAVAPKTNAMLAHGPKQAAEALEIPAALKWLDGLMESGGPPKAALIRGPGEPLAAPGDVRALIRAVAEKYPNLKICLATNGLGLPEFIEDPAAGMLAEITLLVHAVDPEIAMSVYAWVRPGRRTVALSEGVNRLLADQVASAEKLSELGVPVIIESRCFPGANQGHLPEVADVMAGAGAAAMRIISGTSETGECGGVFLERIRGKCAQRIEILPEEPDIEPPAPEVFLDESRPRVAVASTDGAAVNAHLGQSRVLMIYEMQGGAPAFLGTRQTPPPGTEDRWLKLAEILSDCRALLVAHAGEAPRKVLAENGVRLLQSEGGIDKAVERIFKSGSGHKAPDCGKGEC